MKREAEEAFPSSSERTVASALLLLSTSTPTNKRKMMKISESFNWSCSKQKETSSSSSSTTVTSDRDRSSVTVSETRARKLRAIASFVARFRDLKNLKVVQKRRSKSYWISDGQKISSSKPAEDSVSDTISASTSASSCLTSSTTDESNAQSRIGRREIESLLKMKPAKVDGNCNVISSAHMRRRAEAIMRVLASHGRASEVRIRQLLGDSPDTSKALRMLLRREEVKRCGAGGRTDPYIYMLA